MLFNFKSILMYIYMSSKKSILERLEEAKKKAKKNRERVRATQKNRFADTGSSDARRIQAMFAQRDAASKTRRVSAARGKKVGESRIQAMFAQRDAAREKRANERRRPPSDEVIAIVKNGLEIGLDDKMIIDNLLLNGYSRKDSIRFLKDIKKRSTSKSDEIVNFYKKQLADYNELEYNEEATQKLIAGDIATEFGIDMTKAYAIVNEIIRTGRLEDSSIVRDESTAFASASDVGEGPTPTQILDEDQAKAFIIEALNTNNSEEDIIRDLTSSYYTPERKQYTEDEVKRLLDEIQLMRALELSTSASDVSSEEARKDSAATPSPGTQRDAVLEASIVRKVAEAEIGRIDNPFTVPNNGEATLSNGDIFTYMCFWISLADGLNHFRHMGRTDWSWYELRNMLDNRINDSGELLEISPPAGGDPGGKHHSAFEEIGRKLKVKIKVYTLLKDDLIKINYINRAYRIESSYDSDVIIEILALGAHYEFIAGFGNNGSHPLAEKLAYTNLSEEQIEAVITALKGMDRRGDRKRSLNNIIREIKSSPLPKKTKDFMIKDIYKRLRDRRISYREKYLKYKMKYLKLKKSLE